MLSASSLDILVLVSFTLYDIVHVWTILNCFQTFTYYNNIDNSSHHFGAGSAPIHMQYVECRGSESTIANCLYRSGPRVCQSYKGIIGVRCQSGTYNL